MLIHGSAFGRCRKIVYQEQDQQSTCVHCRLGITLKGIFLPRLQYNTTNVVELQRIVENCIYLWGDSHSIWLNVDICDLFHCISLYPWTRRPVFSPDFSKRKLYYTTVEYYGIKQVTWKYIILNFTVDRGPYKELTHTHTVKYWCQFYHQTNSALSKTRIQISEVRCESSCVSAQGHFLTCVWGDLPCLQFDWQFNVQLRHGGWGGGGGVVGSEGY